ncbi:hypothetical protein [Hyphomonas sp.]|uniref:hypothetical protein n=1 Tax=Hyphomonas sp. TaxID=87 RepID=UPI0025BF7B4A|nr:hypothetical protein [Hyphomonas sp.]
MMDPSVRQIVETAYPGAFRFLGGLEVIADMRPVETEFFAAVNETQQSVIAKRMAEGRLTHVSALPLAAKKFTQDFLKQHHSDEIRERVPAMDILAGRLELAVKEVHGHFSARKRWASGVFVILPRSGHVLNAERLVLPLLHDTVEYWMSVDAEAERLGPLDLLN